MVKLENDWDLHLEGEFRKKYYLDLRQFLIEEYKRKIVYPDMYDIFNALKFTPYREVKAVIIGQDPYHGEGQAHGLCFSVKKGVRKPPSLQNIFKEISSDLGLAIPSHGNLEKWTGEGVLLLNTVLTVRGGMANSHKDRGWEIFTDKVISLLNQRDQSMVFLLWGANAKAKASIITNPKHLVLTAAHPSPLSAHKGFFGCRHFSKANEFLKDKSGPIDWEITD